MANLSEAQSRIGRLVALGYTNREVATELEITEQAVKSALHVIFDKLGVWNRVELSARMLKDESPAVAEQSQQRIEAERLKELYRCQVLDSVEDALFDEITKHVVSFFEVPMALVGLMDSARLWFKSSIGFEVANVQRQLTICHHTIKQSHVKVLTDASLDPLFACNPLISQFGVRFYAASPILTTDGYALGVLCIVDRVPRKFSTTQLSLLTSYARLASRQLDLRRELSSLKQSTVTNRSADQDQLGSRKLAAIDVIGKTA